MEKWEYKIIHDPIFLKKYGNEGWELVAVTVTPNKFGNINSLYLKRKNIK